MVVQVTGLPRCVVPLLEKYVQELAMKFVETTKQKNDEELAALFYDISLNHFKAKINGNCCGGRRHGETPTPSKETPFGSVPPDKDDPRYYPQNGNRNQTGNRRGDSNRRSDQRGMSHRISGSTNYSSSSSKATAMSSTRGRTEFTSTSRSGTTSETPISKATSKTGTSKSFSPPKRTSGGNSNRHAHGVPPKMEGEKFNYVDYDRHARKSTGNRSERDRIDDQERFGDRMGGDPDRSGGVANATRGATQEDLRVLTPRMDCYKDPANPPWNPRIEQRDIQRGEDILLSASGVGAARVVRKPDKMWNDAQNHGRNGYGNGHSNCNGSQKRSGSRNGTGRNGTNGVHQGSQNYNTYPSRNGGRPQTAPHEGAHHASKHGRDPPDANIDSTNCITGRAPRKVLHNVGSLGEPQDFGGAGGGPNNVVNSLIHGASLPSRFFDPQERGIKKQDVRCVGGPKNNIVIAARSADHKDIIKAIQFERQNMLREEHISDQKHAEMKRKQERKMHGR